MHSHHSYHGGRRFFTGSLVAANGHLSDVARTLTRSATLARPFHGPPGGICDTSRRTSRTAVSPGASSTPREASDDTSPSPAAVQLRARSPASSSRAARARLATLFTLLLFGAAADDAAHHRAVLRSPPANRAAAETDRPTVIRPTFYTGWMSAPSMSASCSRRPAPPRHGALRCPALRSRAASAGRAGLSGRVEVSRRAARPRVG